MAKLYIAITSFVSAGVRITEGDTITEGHPLMLGREAMFRPFRPTFAHTPAAPEVQRRASTPRPPTVTRPAAHRPKPTT